MRARPPAVWRAVLRLLVPGGDRGRWIVRDLDHEFRCLAAADGLGTARRWYARQALGVAFRYALPRAVRRSFARGRRNAETVRPTRAARTSPGDALHDLGSALGRLRRSPGYAFAFVLTLGLGIGANTAVFSVVRGVLLEPLPYEDANRIVYLSQGTAGSASTSPRFSFVELAELRSESRTLESFAGFGASQFTVLSGSAPHRADAGLVSGAFFELLGLRPALGRTLVPLDDARDAEPVAVLTHSYWTRAFGADPAVLDRTVRLGSGKALRVVGVLRPGPHYSGARDMYVNFAASDHYVGAAMQDQRAHRMTEVYARVTPASSLTEVEAELGALASRFQRTEPEAYDDAVLTVRAEPWLSAMTAEAAPRLVLLMVATGLVLLVACANVVGLSLTRLLRRRRDLAVRAALGAGRARLRWELLAETLLLSAGGALLGLVIAATSIRLLTDYAARLTVRTEEIGLDASVFLFALALSSAVGVAAALVPSLRGAEPGGLSSGASATRTTLGRRERVRQQALVVAQLALAFVLVAGAAGFSRVLYDALQVDLGFETKSVLTLRMYEATAELGRGNRQGPSSGDARAFTTRLIDDLESHPAIEAAAVAGSPPLLWGRGAPRDFSAEGVADSLRSEALVSAVVDPSYFDVVGVEVVAGRALSDADGADTEQVVVINRSMARDLFGALDPVGRTLSTGSGAQRVTYRVVGVTRDTRAAGLEAGAVHEMYQSWRQGPPYPPSTLLVRTTVPPLTMADHVRTTIARLDPNRATDDVRSLEEVRAEVLGPDRLNATLVSAFALLALTIAGVGVLGVLALSVARQTRELGVRMALGARGWRLGVSLAREALTLASLGLALGGVGLAVSARVTGGRAELNGALPSNALDLGGVVAALVLVVLIASCVPAARILRIDPARSIGSE